MTINFLQHFVAAGAVALSLGITDAAQAQELKTPDITCAKIEGMNVKGTPQITIQCDSKTGDQCTAIFTKHAPRTTMCNFDPFEKPGLPGKMLPDRNLSRAIQQRVDLQVAL
ncbi:MAG TPA: hypothetical protein PLF01_03690 [Alphaproteobacteria bacterium]|nr:hypothetical protein [Alphaproteobacteria bacterium]